MSSIKNPKSFFLFIWFCFFLIPFWSTSTPTVSTDSVQLILQKLSKSDPDLVSFIPETKRWHLNNPRPEAISKKLLLRLHDAFYYDVEMKCRLYGWRYLVDWKVILSKAARESFWGTSYLCNRTYNYFGIRRKSKDWICNSFDYCETLKRNDPKLAAFVVFPDFESSLWMFIHTIYSRHFLERLPDGGVRVANAIFYERKNGIPYWQINERGELFADRLSGRRYSADDLIVTWSEHAINNLCIECSRASDYNWLAKVVRAEERTRN